MIPKQKIMDMLFEDIASYQNGISIINSSELNYEYFKKAEALNDFAKKLNKL